jgi:hypothetical protein
MRALAFSAVTAAILFGCSLRDPIDRLMTEVPYEDVPSYLYMPIKLPAAASPQRLLSALSNRFEFQGKQLKILGVRRTHTAPRPEDKIPFEYFTAMLLDTDQGRKILLLQPRPGGWYYKFYDPKFKAKASSD